MGIRSLIPTSALAFGILLSSMASMPWWPGVVVILISAAIYLFLLHRSGDPIKAFRIGKWHIVWIGLLFCGIGMLDEYNNRPLTLDKAYSNGLPAKVSGEIISISPKTYGDRLEVEIESTNGAKAQIRTGATLYKTGDIISFPSDRLTEISKDTSAIVSKIAPMLTSKGVLYSGYVPDKYIYHTGSAKSLRSFCAGIRNEIEIKIEKSWLQKSTSDFIKAILMGDKSGLNEEVRLTFANGGVAHILALSGLHMGILAGMVLWLMWPIKVLGRYKWGYAFAIMLLWCYVFITGMSHSSVRACVMITLAFLAVIAERKISVGHSLCCACMLILLIDPKALFDAGFQLSVVCVASLIAFTSRLNPIRHRQHPGLFRVSEILLSTIIATVASWAFISFYFGQIPLLFLLSNLFLLPLIPLYLGLSVIFTTLLCCGIEFQPLGKILDMGYNFLVWATDTLSSGGSYILDYQIPLYGLAIWILLLSISAYILNRNS